LATRLARMLPFREMAADVSSQDDSIPRIIISLFTVIQDTNMNLYEFTNYYSDRFGNYRKPELRESPDNSPLRLLQLHS